MRTVKEPDVRRQEILDGAIRVFAQYGYDKATIATIARELSISQGLCYRYFPSKEDIYDAAINQYADLILEENLRDRQMDQPIRAWIDGIAQSIVQLTDAEEKDENLYALFHGGHGERLHNELILKVVSKLLPYVQESLCRAKAQGEIRIEDPSHTAIIGLYGEVGMLLAPNIRQEEKIRAIRMGWNRLLGIQD